MTIAVPPRNLDQRLTALAAANVIRSSRASLKRRMRGADLRTAAQMARVIVEEPPRWVETMLIRDLLLNLPRIGQVKTDRLLIACRISLRKTIAGLSDRQRDELLAWLRVLGA